MKLGIGLDKIFCVTSDNGAKMVAAVRELQTEFDFRVTGEESKRNLTNRVHFVALYIRCSWLLQM